MDNMKHRRLQEMDRSDFEVVKGEPDIRGWDVRNSNGKKIGEVEDLIIDAQMKKVRYMVVDLDDNELKLDHHKVLVPIGLAELDKKEDDVILPNVRVEQLQALPDYHRDRLDDDMEDRVCSILGRTSSETNRRERTQQDFYQHDYFNDDNLYKHRMHEARPAQQRRESEYEHGLRLWEHRSEGGIVPEESNSDYYREREIEENARMEMVRNRRNAYKQRRWQDEDRNDYRNYDDRPYRNEGSVERRIRDEGLRDAD